MLLFSVLVAGSFSFGKLVAPEIDPIVLTTVRFAFASVLLAAVLAATGRIRISDHRQPWRYFVLAGLFLLYFVLMFEALRTASPVSTAAIFTTMPLIAAILDRTIFGRGSSATVWVALLIGACGAVWVVFRGSWAALTSFDVGIGEILFFVGTISHAAYAVLIPRLRRGEPLHATTLGVVCAATIMLTLLFWPRLSSTDWAAVPNLVWLVIAYLAIFATLSTFALITIAAARLTSAKVTAYTYLTPLWVVLLEGAVGHGLPSFVVLLGGIPIVVALLMLFQERHVDQLETNKVRYGFR